MRLFFDMLPIVVFTHQSDRVNLYLHKRYFHRLGLYSADLFRNAFGGMAGGTVINAGISAIDTLWRRAIPQSR